MFSANLKAKCACPSMSSISPLEKQSPLCSNLLLLNALSSQINQKAPLEQLAQFDQLLKSCCNNPFLNGLKLSKVAGSPESEREHVHSSVCPDYRPLTSAAKRRHRRRRNQMKRFASQVAATVASILDAKDGQHSQSQSPADRTPSNALTYNPNSFNCNHSNTDHFYDYSNASSYKIKSCLRYVSLRQYTVLYLAYCILSNCYFTRWII